MRILLTAIIFSSLLACTPERNSSIGESLNLLDQNGDSSPQGGVDVGPKGNRPNFVLYKNSLFPIPGTQLLVSISFGWKEKTLPNGLEINHYDGSKITITKASIKGSSIPTLDSLKEYLKVKYPERIYSDIKINGSEGVSTEIGLADGRFETDIYLISVLKDFVHVRMNLQHKGMILANGQSVLASIQLKRAGEPAALSMIKQITLHSGETSKEVPLEFAQTSGTSLKVSDSKKGSGYIVELDPTGRVKFEFIKAKGQGIALGTGKIIPVESIYLLFRSNDRTLARNTVNLKEGGIYLVRTDNWPLEDLVTKILVESLEPGKSVKLKYQTLLAVPPGILAQQPYGKIE